MSQGQSDQLGTSRNANRAPGQSSRRRNMRVCANQPTRAKAIKIRKTTSPSASRVEVVFNFRHRFRCRRFRSQVADSGRRSRSGACSIWPHRRGGFKYQAQYWVNFRSAPTTDSSPQGMAAEKAGIVPKTSITKLVLTVRRCHGPMDEILPGNFPTIRKISVRQAAGQIRSLAARHIDRESVTPVA